jgi:hypothetical protein
MSKRVERVSRMRQTILNYLQNNPATLNATHLAVFPDMPKQTFWVGFKALVSLGYLKKVGVAKGCKGDVGVYVADKKIYIHPESKLSAINGKPATIIPGARVYLMDDRKECLDRHKRNTPVRMQLRSTTKNYVSGATLSGAAD